MVVAKPFALNGPSGTYSHCWIIASAPVVKQHHAEDMRLGALTVDRFPQRIPHANDEPRLQFNIQFPACTEHRPFSIRQLDLATRPAHRRAASRSPMKLARCNQSASRTSSAAARSWDRGTWNRRSSRVPSMNKSPYNRGYRWADAVSRSALALTHASAARYRFSACRNRLRAAYSTEYAHAARHRGPTR